jgi:hypothetical protein
MEAGLLMWAAGKIRVTEAGLIWSIISEKWRHSGTGSLDGSIFNLSASQ